jgi:hypothetical protein
MSRKNKTLRAWQHQNPNGTLQEAWDTAWKAQGSRAYSLLLKELRDLNSRLQQDINNRDKRIKELTGVNKYLLDENIAHNSTICELGETVYDLSMADPHLEFISQVQDLGLHQEWNDFIDLMAKHREPAK